jgi:hypothetical protein
VELKRIYVPVSIVLTRLLILEHKMCVRVRETIVVIYVKPDFTACQQINLYYICAIYTALIVSRSKGRVAFRETSHRTKITEEG